MSSSGCNPSPRVFRRTSGSEIGDRLARLRPERMLLRNPRWFFADFSMFRAHSCVNITGMVRLPTLLMLVTALSAEAAEIDFSRDIRPILSDKCFACHGPDRANQKADLRLDSRDEAIRERNGIIPIVPGNASASELVKRIFAADENDVMPPLKFKNPLTRAEKEMLKAWVGAGANYETHWAFRRIAKPAVPVVRAHRTH